MTFSDYLVACLAQAGVRRIYGVPGLALLPLMQALERQDTVRWVLMAHENAAAHAAAAESKLTGTLGVCATTSGPGALQPLCGVVDALLDRTPLLLLTGLTARANMGHWGFQDVDQAALYRSILPASTAASTTTQGAAVLRAQIATAINRNVATHLALPVDLLGESVPHDDPLFQPSAPKPLVAGVPAATELERAVARLDSARHPIIVVGRRAHGASDAILKIARMLDAPVLASIDGKGVINELDRNYLGVYGLWGFPGLAETVRVVDESDLVLSFGVDYIKPFVSDGRNVQRRDLIQVQSTHSLLVDEYHDQSSQALAGPIDEIARRLADAVTPRAPGELLDALSADRFAVMEDMLERLAQAEARGRGLANPLDFLFALDSRLGPQDVLSIDSGSHALWAAMFLYLKAGQHLLVSSRLGTMGFSIPALIGARLADPQRRPIGFVGDGCFAMTGMELAYAAAMRLPLVIVVVNNGILQNVAAMQANPYGTALPPIDFVAMSRACGGDGLVIDGSTDLLAALDLALAPRDTPFVIDLRCDPELVAPLSKWEASRWAAATR